MAAEAVLDFLQTFTCIGGGNPDGRVREQILRSSLPSGPKFHCIVTEPGILTIL
jgi:hypothetical protein